MRYSRVVIESFGYELAPVVVTSDELEKRLAPVYQKLHVQPGQLLHMTGIQERRYWDPGYTVSQGATAAAENALRDSPVPASAIDTLIYAGVWRANNEPATRSTRRHTSTTSATPALAC